jgi:flagellar protein FlgJ
MSTEQKSPLSLAAEAALHCEQRSGFPALVLLAQWAIESGWGKSSPGNNCFGIKATDKKQRQLLTTKEWFNGQELARFKALGDGRSAVATGAGNAYRREYTVKDWFATYPSLEACFAERVKMANRPRYQPFMARYKQTKDVEEFVRGFAPIYATDPKYAELVLKLVESPKLKDALAEAKLASPAIGSDLDSKPLTPVS